MRSLLLKKNDWNAQGGVTPDAGQLYPAEPVESFINWLRTTNQWRQNPEALLYKVAQTLKQIEKVGPLSTENLAVTMANSPTAPDPHVCVDCGQSYKFAMHLGKHRKAKHPVPV